MSKSYAVTERKFRVRVARILEKDVRGFHRPTLSRQVRNGIISVEIGPVRSAAYSANFLSESGIRQSSTTESPTTFKRHPFSAFLVVLLCVTTHVRSCAFSIAWNMQLLAVHSW